MPEPVADAAPIVIVNEFAEVEVRKVLTRNGMRLEIRSARRDTYIHLDAVALDALSWQGPEFLSRLLADEPTP
jgi:hypothetical protein